MRPEAESQRVLGITRSKAKMYEYRVPLEHHINIPGNPSRLLRLTIGILGDLAIATIHGENDQQRQYADFSAYFFDALFKSRLDPELDPYLHLVGSASYYLAGLPGNSLVSVRQVGPDTNLEANDLDKAIAWLLLNSSSPLELHDGLFQQSLKLLCDTILEYFEHGFDEDNVIEKADVLRKQVYGQGSPRQLLFADLLSALVRKKIWNSARYSLPRYSGLESKAWEPYFEKRSSMRELWPSQHLLGSKGIFSGSSGVVQMPTSAGKTRAMELVIRSSFLAERTRVAVIVAPYRALCHEIRQGLIDAFRDEAVRVSEISDVLQIDFDFGFGHDDRHILVLTPEKLLFTLRQDSAPAASFNLVIFDEGHQFDSGTRGITFELLLTSLRQLIPAESQKILVSAVLPNITSLGDWLNGPGSAIASGAELLPTLRSVGFVSWKDTLGRIEYVSKDEPDKREYFVPRILASERLDSLPRERTAHWFPNRTDGKSIALALALRVIENGSVAIFCGTKAAARNVCETVVDLIRRGYNFQTPLPGSVVEETERLFHLYERNLGNTPATDSARIGIFAHHGDVPQGIRLSVESAMRRGRISLVACTSTLAQGVNLPIRYLIVTTMYQGGEEIKVRDFHNLMGRAGRAGMHTEGSVIFADPEIYDQREIWDKKWRWALAKKLLAPGNSEPCISTLLSLFDSFEADNSQEKLNEDVLKFIESYVTERPDIDSLSAELFKRLQGFEVSLPNIARQVASKVNLIGAIESFLLANWDLTDEGLSEEDSENLAKETLAYFLADEKLRGQITALFRLIRNNIDANVPETERRKTFARTLLSVRDSLDIENWVLENLESVLAAQTNEELLTLIWPILRRLSRNKIFRKIDQPDELLSVAQHWITGTSFADIYTSLNQKDVRLKWGQTRKRKLKIDDVVHLCETGFGFESALLLGAIIEFSTTRLGVESEQLVGELSHLQKRMAYGLPTGRAIWLYELGFTDRHVAQDLDRSIPLDDFDALATLKDPDGPCTAILGAYPTYFLNRRNAL